MLASARRGQDPLFKTKLCKFHLLRQCMRGDACGFAHGREELIPAPDFTRTRMCPEFKVAGHCQKGAACTFAHAAQELRSARFYRASRRAAQATMPQARLAQVLADEQLRASQEQQIGIEQLARDGHLASFGNSGRTKADGYVGLPVFTWSRQTTREGIEEVQEESPSLSRQSTLGTWPSSFPEQDEVASRVEEWPSLSETASTLGVTYSVKNTFVDFGAERDDPAGRPLRRAHSTGGCRRHGRF